MTKTRYSPMLGIAYGLLSVWVFSATGAGLEVPSQEKFSAPRFNAGWVEEVSPGTELELKNDGLHFDGPTHGKGHIRRECGVDLITVSARIAQWGSVYLIWDEDSWCGAGQISPTPFGRL